MARKDRHKDRKHQSDFSDSSDSDRSHNRSGKTKKRDETKRMQDKLNETCDKLTDSRLSRKTRHLKKSRRHDDHDHDRKRRSARRKHSSRKKRRSKRDSSGDSSGDSGAESSDSDSDSDSPPAEPKRDKKKRLKRPKKPRKLTARRKHSSKKKGRSTRGSSDDSSSESSDSDSDSDSDSEESKHHKKKRLNAHHKRLPRKKARSTRKSTRDSSSDTSSESSESDSDSDSSSDSDSEESKHVKKKRLKKPMKPGGPKKAGSDEKSKKDEKENKAKTLPTDHKGSTSLVSPRRDDSPDGNLGLDYGTQPRSSIRTQRSETRQSRRDIESRRTLDDSRANNRSRFSPIVEQDESAGRRQSYDTAGSTTVKAETNNDCDDRDEPLWRIQRDVQSHDDYARRTPSRGRRCRYYGRGAARVPLQNRQTLTEQAARHDIRGHPLNYPIPRRIQTLGHESDNDNGHKDPSKWGNCVNLRSSRDLGYNGSDSDNSQNSRSKSGKNGQKWKPRPENELSKRLEAELRIAALWNETKSEERDPRNIRKDATEQEAGNVESATENAALAEDNKRRTNASHEPAAPNPPKDGSMQSPSTSTLSESDEEESEETTDGFD